MHINAKTQPSEKPRWAGTDWLSKLVNLLIATKPIYGVMKHQARKVLIQTAERNGIAWRQNLLPAEQDAVKSQWTQIQRVDIQYPDYYLKPFHAYTEGNLCWQAAFEAEPATYSMALRVWPQELLSWQKAQDKLRASFHQVLDQSGPQEVQQVLDIGCSVGISTRSLHQFYTQRQAHPVLTQGLDLSAYMLSVAQFRDTDQVIHNWIHAAAENTGLRDASQDLVTLQFVIHELPQPATQKIFAEIHRILKPGGCLAIVDNNPQSPVIQNLPPVLFTLMKSTEPWSDEYYTLNVEELLQSLEFEHIQTTASDPRHRTILGFKPT
jgi:ubiquinone/menaquinone biosynthesis C-methylase UbiE